jgi:aspartyl-tRNA(Asn)/glutamyl-tRNA(Gln) amidotransferase subunit A
MDFLTASFSEISSAVKNKKCSAVEVTRFFLERARAINPKLNAYLCFDPTAEKQAQRIDEKIARGEDPGALAGVPWAIKDMFCTQGLRTTAASKMLENFVPPYDATVVERLKKSGAVILGKLNQDEFAMGSTNETSHFGPCKNPWDLTRVPGGSSGGSAAAQAARLCAGATGTDTGGSIRQPSNFCGIVGVKPTYGRASRYGIISYASSLDQAGPMTSSVADAALALEIICGRDGRDSTCSDKEVPPFSKSLNSSMKGKKIGVLKEYMEQGGLHPDVARVTAQALDALKAQGAEIVEVSVPLTKYAVSIYYLIASSECSSNLARYDGVKYGFRANFPSLTNVTLAEFYSKTRGEGFGSEVKRRIMLGTYFLSSGYYDAYYVKACQVRRLLRDQFTQAFSKCDVILSPVTTAPAYKMGAKTTNPLEKYLNDIFTVSTNLSGLPGMSVPFGTSQEEKLPIGIQLTAAQFEEQKMLDVASALESVSAVKGLVANV